MNFPYMRYLLTVTAPGSDPKQTGTELALSSTRMCATSFMLTKVGTQKSYHFLDKKILIGSENRILYWPK